MNDNTHHGAFCSLCGAWRGELGLEPDPALFVAHIVGIFEEVRRVLHPSGTLWLNIGDSYVAGPTGRQDISGTKGKTAAMFAKGGRYRLSNYRKDTGRHFGALPAKSLMMMPARVALALQDAGWVLRQEITLCKVAPMPESVRDRCTTATEKLFLFARSPRYYADMDAIREPQTTNGNGQHFRNSGRYVDPGFAVNNSEHLGNVGEACGYHPAGRNAWNWWAVDMEPEEWQEPPTVAWWLRPEPLRLQHFAAFPTSLPRRAILAGSSQRGVCPECGAPWRRVVERSGGTIGRSWHNHNADLHQGQRITDKAASDGSYKVETKGWEPTCTHGHDPIPALVLDPFSGSGTTLLVAKRLGRRALGFDLSPEYCRMARERIAADAPLMEYVEEQERAEEQLSMEWGALA